MRPSRRWSERAKGAPRVRHHDSPRARLRDSAQTALRVERGSASLEFLTVGLILLVPLVYLVLAVSAVQAGSFAVEGAARQAARVAVLQRDAGAVDGAVTRAVAIALADYGLDPAAADVAVSCAERGCLEPGVRVSVTVRTEIALPFAPAVLELDRIASVPVEASATQTVSRLAEFG
jgi:hypothetical protein